MNSLGAARSVLVATMHLLTVGQLGWMLVRSYVLVNRLEKAESRVRVMHKLGVLAHHHIAMLLLQMKLKLGRMHTRWVHGCSYIRVWLLLVELIAALILVAHVDP